MLIILKSYHFTLRHVLEIARMTAHAIALRLRPKHRLLQANPDLDLAPVDAVYLWADPSDKEWANRRSKVLEAAGSDKFCTINVDPGPPREPLDELRFSLRSVERYLGGVRNIYLVVDRQLPTWLNLEHPKLHVIEVEDLIVDPDAYPCFNTQAIESYFAKIPGLSERFLYLNDDFFLTEPINADDFFSPEGHPRVRLGRALAPVGQPTVADEGDAAGTMNAGHTLDAAFGKRTRFTVMHRPYPHRRSLFIDAEERFPEAFAETRASRFRSPSMYALHSFLIPYFASEIGRAELVPPRLAEKDMFHWSSDPVTSRTTEQRVHAHRGNAFCMQEVRGEGITPAAAEAFHKFMESLYPARSTFEKTPPESPP
jgi:hypothetical protein